MPLPVVPVVPVPEIPGFPNTLNWLHNQCKFCQRLFEKDENIVPVKPEIYVIFLYLGFYMEAK